MTKYLLMKIREDEREFVFPLGQLLLDNSYIFQREIQSESLAIYTLKKIASFYERNVVENEQEDEFENVAAFGLDVYDLLKCFSFVRQNLTINETCVVHNNPALLEITVALFDVREEFNDTIDDNNKYQDTTDFSDYEFGEKVIQILRKRRYIENTIKK